MRTLLTLIVLVLTLQPAVAERATAGALHCYGPSLAIGSNLPLGTTASETEVVDAHAFIDPSGSRVDGWVYTTRKGEEFIQVVRGAEQQVSTVLDSIGAASAAASVTGNKPYSFIAMSRVDITALNKAAAKQKLLQECPRRPRDS